MRAVTISALFLTFISACPVWAGPPAQQQQNQKQVQPAVRHPTTSQARRNNNANAVVRSEHHGRSHDYVIEHRPSNWNRRPRLVDVGKYHRNIVAVHRYHWRPYVRPHGWYYRRWVFGERLPLIFWTRNYWITDYWMFGLEIPPLGCEWVRYGNDALLIDTRTGEILQVIYGVFY